MSSNFVHHLETKAKSLISCRILVYLLLACALFGIFSIGLPATAGTTLTGTVPLVTDSIVVSHISSTAAVISWATNGDSSSRVFFDTVSHNSLTDYRFSSPLDPAPVSDHHVSLQDLSPFQTYLFRVVSSSENLTTISTEYSFATLSAPENGFGGQTRVTVISPGVTDLSLYTSDSGVFNLDAVAASNDKSVIVNIPRGVRGETSDGAPLKSVSIIPLPTPPPPTPGISVIGLPYDLGPDGATFEPAVTLTFSYSPEDIPAGIAEENLVIAVWDSSNDRWEVLPGVVDPTSHTITVSVTHFSRYAILARDRPASFVISELTIKPDPMVSGEMANISILAANSGDLSANCHIMLKINGEIAMERDIILRGGAGQNVTFSFVAGAAGAHTVDINGLTGRFTVIPSELPLPTPAEINSRTVDFEVTPPAAPLEEAVGWFIGAGSLALGVAFVIFIARFTKRRKSRGSSDFADHP